MITKERTKKKERKGKEKKIDVY